MDQVIEKYFSNLSKNKYLALNGEVEKHKFSSLKASIANKATVKVASVSEGGKVYQILYCSWGKPHYFLIDEQNNVKWLQGETTIQDSDFEDLYTFVVSCKEFVTNVQNVAKLGVAYEWSKLDKYVKSSDSYYMNLLKM